MNNTCHIIIILLFSLWGTGSGSLRAQNSVQAILEAVEQNNTALKALREQAAVQQWENKTGIFLPGPEAEISYLRGSPESTGNRTDISIRQRFDIPTLAGMKARAAREQNSLLEAQYRMERLAILAEASRYCNDIIYCNALLKELSTRLEHARTIAESYRKRLDRGDASRPEYNRAMLHLSAARGEITRVETERAALLAELARMNGGAELPLSDDRYAGPPLPGNFEEWFARAAQQHPALVYAGQQAALRRQEVTLQKAAALPAFTAGYVSERTAGQQYRGVSIGLSLPLWENKNRVNRAKAAAGAAKTAQDDSYRQLYGRLQAAFRRAAGLKALSEEYRRALAAFSNTALLKAALDAGEISLPDYLLELGSYYTAVNSALEAEREYRDALIIMNYEL